MVWVWFLGGLIIQRAIMKEYCGTEKAQGVPAGLESQLILLIFLLSGKVVFQVFWVDWCLARQIIACHPIYVGEHTLLRPS